MEKKKKRPLLRIVILSLLGVLIIASLVLMRFGGFSVGESASPTEFATYAGTVEDISIPDNVTVVALGEATHGNVKFQQLKLDVFRIMVEK